MVGFQIQIEIYQFQLSFCVVFVNKNATGIELSQFQSGTEHSAYYYHFLTIESTQSIVKYSL